MISCDIFYAVTDTCQKIKTLLVGASCSSHQKKVDEKKDFLIALTTLFYREPLLTANSFAQWDKIISEGVHTVFPHIRPSLE